MANLKLNQSSGSGTITLKGAASGSNDVELTLPNDIGSNDQYLKLSGVSGKTGTLSFDSPSGGAALTGSTNNTICTVTGANAIQGETGLTYDGNDLYVKSGEGYDASIHLYSDEGDDDADKWRILNAQSTSNKLRIASYAGGSWADHLNIETGGDLEVVRGNLKFATGKGLDFSATADTGATGASASSELFADYEEGSWTPTLAEGSATFTKCKYVRIGNMCYLNFHCDNVTDRTSSTNWLIAAASLPFSPYTDFTDNMIMGIVAHRYTSHADNATLHASMNGSGVGWYSSNDTEGDDAYSSFKHEHVDATYSNFHFSGWYYV